MVFSLKISFYGGLLLIFINNYVGGKFVFEGICCLVFFFCYFFYLRFDIFYN